MPLNNAIHTEILQNLYNEALGLLHQLIEIESFSQTEDKTATLIDNFLSIKNIKTKRHLNNVFCYNKYFDNNKPSILLNSHHDTVKPNKAYTNNPFKAFISNDKLYGLGSTDAGASVVSLIACFLYFYGQTLMPYNIILAITAEEEISGTNGIESVLKLLPSKIDFGIVGEPTQMDLAIAEKGLLVIDCTSKGKPGHAARNEGDNAISHAIKDIAWFQSYSFEKESSLLGANKMTVTIIQGGNQHNVIPDECTFTVDIRLNELYTHEEVLDIISLHTKCLVKARSFRLKSSCIKIEHPIVQAGLQLNKKIYGSPTTSDKALLPFPSLKCGPGYSAQSHSANEFVEIKDIKEAINQYINMLEIINSKKIIITKMNV